MKNDWNSNPFIRKWKAKNNSKLPFDANEISGSDNRVDWMAIATYILAGFGCLYFGIHILVYLMGAYN